MKRKIDPIAINSVSEYFREAANDLEIAKQKLIKDISLISNFYKGEDATQIMEKYTNRVLQIDSVINNISRYATFMKKMSGGHSENFNTSKKNFSDTLLTISEIPRIDAMLDDEVFR